MGSISYHIRPLASNSLGGGHAQRQTHAHTDVRTETILRNQAHTGCRHAPGLIITKSIA